MTHRHANLNDTVYFWFAANDTSGSGGDGASAAADVREAGATASDAPILSPTPALLTHASYPAGCYEIAVAATTGNGFSATETYGVFCTLAIDSQNPTGFVGSFTLDPIIANVKEVSDDSTAADNLELALENGSAGYVASDMRQIIGVSQSATDLKDFADAGYDPATNKVEGVKTVDTTTTNSDMRGTDSAALAANYDATRAGYLDNLSGHTPQTGDSFARIGANGAGLTSVGLADDAITSAKFDESTAHPLKSADTGATQIARVGADGDTLETLSDQLDTAQTDLDNAAQYKADVSALALEANVQGHAAAALTAYDPPTNTELTARTLPTASYFDPASDEVDVGKIKGTALTESNAGDVADSFSFFFDVDPTTTKTVDDVGVAGSGITQQEVRDAMKLAPTGGAPGAGSVDKHLDDVLEDTNELQADWADAGRLDNILDGRSSHSAADVTGGTTVAAAESAIRGGSDTLDTLSDQMDTAQTDLDNPDQYKADVSALATTANMEARTLLAASYGTAANVTDAVLDEILSPSSHNIAGSVGRRLRTVTSVIIANDQAEVSNGPGANQIQLASSESSSDGTFDPSIIGIIAGTGSGQSRRILQYAGATRIATLNRDWKISPDTTSEYVIALDAGGMHVNEGLAQGGGSTSITLNALASTDNNAYNGQLVFLVSGTGQDQVGLVTAYNGSTKVATITSATNGWVVTPDATSGYIMMPFLNTVPTMLGTAGINLTNLGGMSTGMKAEVNAEADTALADYDGPTNAEMVARTLLVANYFDPASDTVDVGKIDGNATSAANLAKSALAIVTGAAVAGTLSTTQMTTNLTEATTGHYIGRIIIWTTGPLYQQGATISGYDGATKMLTFSAVTEAPQIGNEFVIL